jgi:hypothetical protein
VDSNRTEITDIFENGAALTNKALRIADQIDTMTVSINGLLSDIRSGRGSVGMLVSDTLLAKDVRSAVTGLDTLVTDISKQGLKLRVKLGFGKSDKK